MAESLAGKTALITGGVRRIGRATALALASEGVNVVIHIRDDTSVPEASGLLEEIRGRGVEAWTVAADLAKPQDRESLIERAGRAAGALDILINNASVFRPDAIDNVTFDAVVAHMQVNAWAPFALSREFARQVGRGQIVNILDTKIAGYDFAHTSYIMSKQALALLTRMTALEFAPDIIVNAVAPGLILPPPGEDEAYLDRLAATVPLRRHGGPNDVADTILFLLKSDFITGQIIYVDGGWHLGSPGAVAARGS
jgi:pteridine reductase